MSWFEQLTGFHEVSPEQVRDNLVLEGSQLKSVVNGRVFTCGTLQTPSLAELRERVKACAHSAGKLSVREVVGDVRALHVDESNAGALFQVASQFNLLEMTSPKVTPEFGVGIYGNDHTQGPACAMACGAGTIFRNYFASVNGQTGQSAGNQLDCLADLGTALNNAGNRLWEMRNGYALASQAGLAEIAARLQACSAQELDEYRQLLRIGIQWDTQVTVTGCSHLVTQAYCSAMPVAYARHHESLWADFARLVLDAAYEATICTAILNSAASGNNRVYLTSLGGGVFGNPLAWIMASMERALTLYQDWNLDAAIVSYGASNQSARQLADRFPQ